MRHSGCNEPAPAMEMPTPHLAKRENPMRLVDVVLASVLIGLALGYLNMGNPDAAKADGAGDTQLAASDSARSLSERITWLRTPAMHAPAQVR